MQEKLKQLIRRERVNLKATVWSEEGPWITKSPSSVPNDCKHTPANGAGHDYPITWHPTEMTTLRHFKESVSYGTHSPYVKERLSNRAIQDKITPQDGRDWCCAGGCSAGTMAKTVERGGLEY